MQFISYCLIMGLTFLTHAFVVILITMLCWANFVPWKCIAARGNFRFCSCLSQNSESVLQVTGQEVVLECPDNGVGRYSLLNAVGLSCALCSVQCCTIVTLGIQAEGCSDPAGFLPRSPLLLHH